jgi:hypothetical protein
MLGDQGLTTRVLKSIMGQDSHTVVGEVIDDQNQSLVETGEMALSCSLFLAVIELGLDILGGVTEYCDFAVRRISTEWF